MKTEREYGQEDVLTPQEVEMRRNALEHAALMKARRDLFHKVVDAMRDGRYGVYEPVTRDQIAFIQQMLEPKGWKVKSGYNACYVQWSPLGPEGDDD